MQGLPPRTSSLLAIPTAPQAGQLLGLFTDPTQGVGRTVWLPVPAVPTMRHSRSTNGFLSMTAAGVASGIKGQYSILVLATPAVGVPVEQIFDFASAQSGPINFSQLAPDFVPGLRRGFPGQWRFHPRR